MAYIIKGHHIWSLDNMEIHQSSNGELEVKRNNIGQLFREAQQNIFVLEQTTSRGSGGAEQSK